MNDDNIKVQLVWRSGQETQILAENEPLDPDMTIQDLKKFIIPRLDKSVDMAVNIIIVFRKGSILSDFTSCADAGITNGDKIIFWLKQRVCIRNAIFIQFIQHTHTHAHTHARTHTHSLAHTVNSKRIAFRIGRD